MQERAGKGGGGSGGVGGRGGGGGSGGDDGPMAGVVTGGKKAKSPLEEEEAAEEAYKQLEEHYRELFGL